MRKFRTFRVRMKEDSLTKALRYLVYRYYLKRGIAKFDFSKEHIIKADDCTLCLIPNDKGISTELLIFKKHEPLQTQILSKKLKEGMICLDIGSNLGYYATLEGKLVGKNGKVFAIEPSPINFGYLKKNIILQNNHNIKPYNFACGNRDGKTKFSISNSSNWSRVLDEIIPKSIHGDETYVIDIPMKTIDSFVNEQKIEKIDLIRMDLEGYEKNTYAGMAETIKKFKPMLAMEIHKLFLGSEDTKEFLLLLKKNGYEISYFIPRERDYPILGTTSDVKKITINQLIERIDNNLIKDVFTLVLASSERK